MCSRNPVLKTNVAEHATVVGSGSGRLLKIVILGDYLKFFEGNAKTGSFAPASQDSTMLKPFQPAVLVKAACAIVRDVRRG